jgi:predicted aspartyl protease
MRQFGVGAMVALLAGFGFAGAASAACQLQTIAEYHLKMQGDQALIQASINGNPVWLLVDTGSYATIITRPAAAKLGLTLSRVEGLTTYGVGGSDVTDAAMVSEFRLGDAVAHNVDLVVTGKDLESDDFQGLLGESILAQGDLELDFANGVMRIFRPHDCVGDQVVYWGAAYSVAPIAPSVDPDELNVYVTLDGQRTIAKLDTGADPSFVTAGAAERAGMEQSAQAARAAAQSGAVSPTQIDSSVAVFQTFAIGDETIRNARLHVADLFAKDTETPTNSHLERKIANLPDMLLGADFIHAHRIYVARSQGKIYFSYNGGPIFRTSAPAVEPPPAAPVKP